MRSEQPLSGCDRMMASHAGAIGTRCRLGARNRLQSSTTSAHANGLAFDDKRLTYYQ